LVAASKALADEGVVFVGINTRDTNIVPARQFVKKKGVDYPSIYDPSGRVLLKLRDTVPPTAIPSTLVIDAEGRIAATIFGAATRKTFEQLALDVAGGQ
ncbi:MAG TPA: TlpA disulfide reductase family protein, partial [Actinopolymorphaceae bacterium]